MKILLMPVRYLPNIGGVETVVFNLARELVQKGHEVTIVTARSPLRLSKTQRIDNIAVYRLPFFTPHALIKADPISVIKFGLKWLFLPILMPLVIVQLRSLIRSGKPDMINVHYIGANAFYVLLVRKLIRLPFLVSIHGEDVERDARKSSFARWLTKRTLHQADKVLSNSKALLFEAQKFFPSIAEKSLVVGNGVNLDEFNSTLKYQHQRPYVLSVGRFVQKKGFDILIQAFAKVTGKHPEVDLIIAGDGEELNRCKSLALQLGLNQKVFFLGAVDHQTVVELLLQCEIFVLPSRREPFGLVILEAMAAGKPVVATRVGGVPEIVSHLENGLLVEPDSPEELSKATCLLLDDPELGYDLARAGYELLKRHFTWQEVAERYINVCEKLLEA